MKEINDSLRSVIIANRGAAWKIAEFEHNVESMGIDDINDMAKTGELLSDHYCSVSMLYARDCTHGGGLQTIWSNLAKALELERKILHVLNIISSRLHNSNYAPSASSV